MTRHQINLKVSRFPISRELISRTIDDQLKKRGERGKIVEVEVVGVNKIRTLNKKFLNQDRATDVLSFPLGKIPGEKYENIGTIVVCNDIIKSQAKDHQVAFEGEFLKMLRHGVDHLLGIHHK